MRRWTVAAMALLVGVVGTTGISISQGSRPDRSGRILFSTFDGLYVTDASGVQPTRLLKGVRPAALSPHGDLVAYADDRAVRVVSLLDGQSLTLVNVPGERIGAMAWSPDQTRVAYTGSGDVPTAVDWK